MSKFRLSLALLTLAGLAPARTFAQSADGAAELGPERVELHYTGGPGCPSEGAFVEELSARVRRPIEWAGAEATTKIVVDFVSSEQRALGNLQVLRKSGEPTQREFVAGTCAEVGSALALVAALALDPNARTEPLSAINGSEGQLSPPTVAVSVAETSPVPAPVAQPPALPPAPRRVATSRGYVGWLGPAASLMAGYAPASLGLLGFSLGARPAEGGFSPSVQLTPMWGKTGTTGPSASGGTFSWTLARLEGCPARVRLADSLNLEPCALVEVGRLAARGAEDKIAVSVPADRWWLAGGIALALHVSVAHWFLRLEGQGLMPATRDEFVFRDPDQRVHQASPVVAGASLGVGFELGQ